MSSSSSTAIRAHARDPGSWGLAICALALVAVVYLLVDESILFARRAAGAGEIIARIESVVSDVRSRPASVPVWETVGSEQELRQRDHLFTAAGARAEVKLKDETRFSVEELSLVVVELERSSALLDIRKGLVYIVPGSSQKEVQFVVNGVRGAVAAGDSEALVNVGRDGTAEVVVLRGSARLGDGAGQRAIGRREVGRVAPDGALGSVTRLPVSLGAPAFNADVPVAPGGAVDFTWSADEPVTGQHLELARDSQFADVVYAAPVTGASARVPEPPAGQLYWRVRAQKAADGAQVFSDVRRIGIVRRAAPAITAPRAGEALAFGGPARTLPRAVFHWSAPYGMRGVRLEVARDAAFTELVAGLDAARAPLAVDLAAGEYHARVRGRYDGGAESEWSVPTVFSLGPVAALDAPVSQAPADGERVVFAGDATPPVAFAVAAGEAPLKRLVVEISARPDFAALVATVSSVRAAASWVPPASGQYHWRTRVEDPLGRVSPFGAPRRLVVAAAAVGLVEPAPAAVMPARGAAERRTFRWTAPAAGKRVRFEVARDADFRESVFARDTSESSVVWEEPEAGRYHWRVVVDPEGAAPTPSESRPLEVIERPRLKAPTAPAHKEILIEPDAESGWRWRDWLFPVAYAGTGGGKARFTWEPVEGAVAYRVQIARDTAFDTPLVDEVTKEPVFVWTRPEAGSFFYRVMALDEDGEGSEFSAAAELVVRHPAVDLVAPRSGARHPRERPLELSWKRHAAADAYVVELTSNGDFAAPAFTRQTDSLRLSTSLEAAGRWSWRVRAVTADGATVAVSAPREIVAIAAPSLAAPRLKAPADGERVVVSGARPQVAFAWDEVPGAARYVVTLRRNGEAWEQARRIVTTAPRAAIELDAGDYAWRVAAAGTEGGEGAASEPLQFFVHEATATVVTPPPPAPLGGGEDSRGRATVVGFGIGAARVKYDFASSRVSRLVDDGRSQGAAFGGEARLGRHVHARLRATAYSLVVDEEMHALVGALADVAGRWPASGALAVLPYVGFGGRDTLIFRRVADAEATAPTVAMTLAGFAGVRLLVEQGRFRGELGGDVSTPVQGGALRATRVREAAAGAVVLARIAGSLSAGLAYDLVSRRLDGVRRRGDDEAQAAALEEQTQLATARLAWLF